MDDEGGGKGVWIGLALAVAATLLFAILWFLRGGDNTRLKRELDSLASSSASAARRLENDLASARSSAEAAARRATETERQLRDDARRAADSASQAERRLRADLETARRDHADALAREKSADETAKVTAAGHEAALHVAKLAREEAEAVANRDATARRIAEEKLQQRENELSAEIDRLRATAVDREAIAAELADWKAKAAGFEKQLAAGGQAGAGESDDAKLQEMRKTYAERVKLLVERANATREKLEQRVKELETRIRDLEKSGVESRSGEKTAPANASVKTSSAGAEENAGGTAAAAIPAGSDLKERLAATAEAEAERVTLMPQPAVEADREQPAEK